MRDNQEEKEKDLYMREREVEKRITLLIMLGVISLLLIVIIVGILIHGRLSL